MDIAEFEPISDYLMLDQPRSDLGTTVDEVGLVPGSDEYKLARKRRQTRESAARARARKRMEHVNLEKALQQMADLSTELTIENAALKSENQTLKKELDFYQGLLTNSRPTVNNRGKQSKWLMATVTFTTLCVIMILQEEAEPPRTHTGERALALLPEQHTAYSIILFAFLAVCCAVKTGLS